MAIFLRILCLLWISVVTGPAAAALTEPLAAEATATATEVDAVLGEDLDAWQPLTLEAALGKATAFELVSSLGEAMVFLAFYGGTLETYALVFGVSVLSAGAVYILHDYAWEGVLTHVWQQPGGQPMPRDDPAVIAAKTASYRVVSSSRSFVVGQWLGAADVALSASFALGVAVVDSLIYATTEWLFAGLGKPRPQAEPASL